MADSGSRAPASLCREPVADEVDQPGLEHLLSLPELGILDALDPLPGLGQSLVPDPVGPQVPIE